MIFSMNGFRKNLNCDIENLRELIQSVIDDNDFDKEDLVDAMNQVICHSNTLNCVSIEGNKDFSLMEDLHADLLEMD